VRESQPAPPPRLSARLLDRSNVYTPYISLHVIGSLLDLRLP
jgi:hypothetical protein